MKLTIHPGKQPLVIFVFAYFAILALSYIPEGYMVGSYSFKKIDLFMDVHPDETIQPTSSNLRLNSFNEAGMVHFGLIDNLFVNLFNPAELFFSPVTAAPAASPKIENAAALKKFFDALKQSGSKKIRIAHYGDSAIEGDNISGDFRKNLQSKFGGNGVGIVGITAQDKQFRTTTDMDWSQDWKTASLITSNPEKLTLGINGFIYQPVANSWVRLAASGRSSNVKYFTAARILYTSDKNVSIKYMFDDKNETTVELKAARGVAEFVLAAKAKVKSVKITVVNPSKCYLYGVSLEEANGVYVDNFPLRGNSGAGLRDLDMNTLKEFDKLLSYKLIVLNFGLNMTGQENKDFGWYGSAMERVLTQYKEAFPQASFLVVSVQDKSIKKGSQFVTDPSVLKLIEMQKQIAAKSGVAFFNLFEAMGGMNAMSDWVEQGLAEKDYTHMKLTGSKKMADLLTEALLGAQQ
ncbi:MAG: hypothetical protein HYV28_20195 [Ignavibacteriales bacterium]|nr:hypothetical protein [Ignavibacteriales bacterium]